MLLLFGRDIFGGPPSPELFGKDLLDGFVVGGVLLVLPSFVAVTLPLSIVDYRRAGSGQRFHGMVYFGALLFAGLVLTVISHHGGLDDIGWAPESVRQPILFFIPFIPYAAVTAFTIKRLQLPANQGCAWR
jgi:hypothetical protein